MGNKKKNEGAEVEEKVVKIQPYPIPVQLIRQEGSPPITARILKLTEVGFICRIESGTHVKVSENWSCQFELPVFHKLFREHLKVIKTYEGLDHYVKGNISTKSLMVEYHFRSLDRDKHELIRDFLAKIHQKA